MVWEDVDVMFFNEIHVCLVSLLTLAKYQWGGKQFFKLLCVYFIVEP